MRQQTLTRVTLGKLLNKVPMAVFHVLYSHRPSNKYEKYISRLI